MDGEHLLEIKNKHLMFQLEIQELITEREMMVAENNQREHLGQSMAYTVDAFDNLQSRLRELRDRLIKFIGAKK